MVLIPLKDGNPLKRIPFQFVTVVLMAACGAVFLYQASLDEEGLWGFIHGYGMVPALVSGQARLAPELASAPPVATLVTSMFLHGGWMHLIGNMLFLWVFGDNVEDSMGHGRFLLFYLLCGLAAGGLHFAIDPASTIPTIGASGAISGVLGAYLVLHPKAPVTVLALRFLMTLPAYVVLGFWIFFQVINVWAEAEAGGNPGGGVAWWAHIGGFVAGALLIVPMRHKTVPLFDRAPHSSAGEGAVFPPGPESRARARNRSIIPTSQRRDR